MALAPYFDRAALAAAQVIAGFDEHAFRDTLEQTTVGISLDEQACSAREGDALADLAVRLLARLYPRLQIVSPDTRIQKRLSRLATAINPRVELVGSGAEIGIVVGETATRFPTTVFAGSDGWIAKVGSKDPRMVGTSPNPFGPGAAACIAASSVFRFLFLGKTDDLLDETVAFCTWTGDWADVDTTPPPLPDPLDIGEETVLVGLGAIGSAALWTLSHCPIQGVLHLVDHQSIELSNLQRYVLTEHADEGSEKTLVAERALGGTGLDPIVHSQPWAEFVNAHGYEWPAVAVALDSARDRRAVQAGLPEWIANSWTQPGDLGVSLHGRFGEKGACVGCLYLRTTPTPNEDELVAQALGVPERQQQVRDLLFHGTPVPADLLEAVAAALQVSSDSVKPFAGQTMRELYVEGLCGGAVIGLERIDGARQEVHVPLAHQSALAGVLLAAGLARHWMGVDDQTTRVTRINVLRPLGVDLSLSAQKTKDERCLCHDPDFVGRYKTKWPRTIG